MRLKEIILMLLIFLSLLTGCTVNNEDTKTIEQLSKEVEEKERLLQEITSNYEKKISDYELRIAEKNERIEELEISLKRVKVENDRLASEVKQLQGKNTTDFYCQYYEKHFQPYISSLDAKTIIEDTALRVINLLKEKNMSELTKYVHPTMDVRFTPYTTVSLENDLVFSKDDISNFFYKDKEYLWGYYDGSGEEILLNTTDYYDRFVYDADFANAEKIGYNEVLSSNNNLENQFAIYHNSIIVEYYFSGFNEDFVGMDWRSLRLVFQKYEDRWYLVGIIHNEWTI